MIKGSSSSSCSSSIKMERATLGPAHNVLSGQKMSKLQTSHEMNNPGSFASSRNTEDESEDDDEDDFFASS